jgi:uncharacterized protein YgiM (DUF1202 family)
MQRYGKYTILVILAVILGVVGALGLRQLIITLNVKAIQAPGKAAEAIKEAAPTPKVEPEASAPKYRQAVVNVNSATLRDEPSFESDPVTYASRGTALKIVASRKGEEDTTWYKVKISDGRECWISGKVVRLKE